MGYEVYLALDEFSWSKKTQPRLQRRKILSMSVSDEENIYIFPDDIPVNIANPSDLARLKKIFEGKELSFVAGSDVMRKRFLLQIRSYGKLHPFSGSYNIQTYFRRKKRRLCRQEALSHRRKE